MIFITIGTANKGFDRLLQKCDEIAKKHNIIFFAQTGSSKYIPQNIDYKQWLSKEEINIKYKEARAFIVHGGFGTLSEVLRLEKPIIVIPRTFENGEAVNDQSDISIKLDSLGFVKCILDLKNLEEMVLNIDSIFFNRYKLESNIPNILKEKIDLLNRSGKY